MVEGIDPLLTGSQATRIYANASAVLEEYRRDPGRYMFLVEIDSDGLGAALGAGWRRELPSGPEGINAIRYRHDERMDILRRFRDAPGSLTDEEKRYAASRWGLD